MSAPNQKPAPVTPPEDHVTHGGEAISLQRATLAALADAPIGTLVYTDTQGAATLQRELERLLAERGRALRDLGAYHLEIVGKAAIAAPTPGACRFCSGAVWCGRCRRCGTPV